MPSHKFEEAASHKHQAPGNVSTTMQNATPRDMVVTPREMTMMGPAIVLPTQVGAPYDRKPDIEVSAAMERGNTRVDMPSFQPAPPKANNSLLYSILALLGALLVVVLALTAMNTNALNAIKDKPDPAYPKFPSSFAAQGPPKGENNCAGTKPKKGFENFECVEEEVDEQSAADVSSPFKGTLKTEAEPIMTSYWQAGICPVNVHWHLGSEHRSAGQYDEQGKGPSKPLDWEGKGRMGLRCNKYDASDKKFTTPYKWEHCKHMQVGETYEVHWPHSGIGACGTVNQYQTPFYDGVFCNVGQEGFLTSTNKQIGVQAQVFTIVNDESYYYPDLIKGMIVDGEKGDDMVFYTGSTTGDSRSNTICSKYSPITWQVDRTCHLISASTFDKMCADMMAQRDDMSDDVHPHGSREVVSPELTANNMRAGSLSAATGRATIP